MLAQILVRTSGHPRTKLFWFHQHTTLYTKHKPTTHSYRYRVFKENLAEIVRLNGAQDSYRVGVNFLTDLTAEEQSLYQGLNATDGVGVVGATGTVEPVLPVDTTEVNWSER